jgi:predicted flap endonuclease-1-like 5' DNA nuclease
MSSFLCWIWPYLFGGLLGWLAAGWLAHRALARKPRTIEKIVDRPVDRPVDRIVEKVVDNPAHLAEIAALTATAALVPNLRTQLSALQAAPPKVVEKIVEKPVDRIVEKIVDRPVDRIVEKIVEKPVDRIVEKVVEKVIDNPKHVAQIAALTATAALVPNLRTQLSALQAAPPKVVEKIVEKPVDRIVEKIVDRPVDRVVEKIVEKPVDRIVEKRVPDMAGIEERDRKLADWSTRYADLEAKYRLLQEGPAIDVQAARAAGLKLKGPDDLEIVEGIGPKIAALLNEAGVHRFRQLAQMTPAQIQLILDRAGPNFKLANPASWPEQAALAANNQWATLKTLQDVLYAGVKK